MTNLLPPAVEVGATALACNDIQAARQFPASDAKDALKTDVAVLSGYVGLAMFLLSLALFAQYLLESNAWAHMSRQQRMMVVGLAVSGALAQVWPTIRLGLQEENTTAAAGAVSAIASTFMGAAHVAARVIDDRNKADREPILDIRRRATP